MGDVKVTQRVVTLGKPLSVPKVEKIRALDGGPVRKYFQAQGRDAAQGRLREGQISWLPFPILRYSTVPLIDSDFEKPWSSHHGTVVPGIQSSVGEGWGWSGSEHKQVNDWPNWECPDVNSFTPEGWSDSEINGVI